MIILGFNIPLVEMILIIQIIIIIWLYKITNKHKKGEVQEYFEEINTK